MLSLNITAYFFLIEEMPKETLDLVFQEMLSVPRCVTLRGYWKGGTLATSSDLLSLQPFSEQNCVPTCKHTKTKQSVLQQNYASSLSYNIHFLEVLSAYIMQLNVASRATRPF